MTDAQTKVGFSGTCGSHDQLVLVTFFEALTQGIVSIDLELSGGWESIITLTWR
jgi:hypothetical protein